MHKTYLSRSLQSALIVVLMAAIWVLFAPAQFGGGASYVIIAGASMEPTMHQGDLVIVRPASTYEIGEVVTYRHPRVGPVIHRIIDREGPRYTLQGDNNDWIDSYEPVNTEILGKSWLHVPGAAEKLLWLRTPAGLGLLSLSIGIMFLITITKKGERKNSHSKQDADMLSKWLQQTQSLKLGEWVFPLGIVLFASILLGFFAFTRPEFQAIPADIPYSHQGSFSYQAVGSPSVYAQGEVESGQAIFHALVHKLELDFSYEFQTAAPADLQGTYSVLLRISEPNGWQRTIELQPETAFEGTSFTTSAALDLQQITGIVGRLKERTGLNRQNFNVDLDVPAEIAGTIAGLDFEETFTATLPFQLDEIELYVSQQNPLGENGNPFMPATSAYLPNEQTIPNTLNILGLNLTVSKARQIALIGGGVSLVLIALIMTPALAVSLRSESERIKLMHAELLLDVNEIPFDGNLEWVDVAAIDDLVKLSESTGGLILHKRDGSRHTYVIKDGGTGYRLTLEDPNGIDAPTDDADPVNPEGGRWQP